MLTIGGMENDVTLFLPKFKLAEAIPIKWSAQKSKKYELPMKNTWLRSSLTFYFFWISRNFLFPFPKKIIGFPKKILGMTKKPKVSTTIKLTSIETWAYKVIGGYYKAM